MRNNRLKVIGIALVAVVALSAFAASFASAADAPRWRVAGGFLKSGQTEAVTGTTAEASWLNIPKLNLRLSSPKEKCHLEESKIIGSGENSPGEVTGFLKCEEFAVDGVSPTVCKVHSEGQPVGTVTTKALKGHLVWLAATGEQAGITLEPESTEWVKLIIEGTECSAAGEFPVKNGIIGKIDPVATEVTTGTLTFPPAASTTCNEPILTDWSNATPRVSTAHTQLSVGAQPATFCTTFSIHLTSDKNWGVFAG